MCEILDYNVVKQEPKDVEYKCMEFIHETVSVKTEPVELNEEPVLENENDSKLEKTVSVIDDEDENNEEKNGDESLSSSYTESCTDVDDISITGVELPTLTLPLYPNNIPRCGNRLTTVTAKKCEL